MYTREEIRNLPKVFTEANKQIFNYITIEQDKPKEYTYCYKCSFSKVWDGSEKVRHMNMKRFTSTMYCLKGGFLCDSLSSCKEGILSKGEK